MLGYLFWAAHPDTHFQALADALDHPESHALSAELAQSLGVGRGCDSEGDEESRQWTLQASDPALPR